MMSFPGNHIQAVFPWRACAQHEQLCRRQTVGEAWVGQNCSMKSVFTMHFLPLSLLFTIISKESSFELKYQNLNKESLFKLKHNLSLWQWLPWYTFCYKLNSNY